MRSGTGAAILVTTAVVLLLAWPEGGAGAVGVGGASGGAADAGSAPRLDVGSGGAGGELTTAAVPAMGEVPTGAPTSAPSPDVAPQTVALPSPPPATAADSKVLVLGSVFFPSKATQLGPDARRMLDGIANTYKGTAQQLEIVGHADARGSAQANMRLSAQRAEAVRSYLVAKGVPASNMTVSYDGARTPMAQGIDPEANAQNRRVEIRVP